MVMKICPKCFNSMWKIDEFTYQCPICKYLIANIDYEGEDFE